MSLQTAALGDVAGDAHRADDFVSFIEEGGFDAFPPSHPALRVGGGRFDHDGASGRHYFLVLASRVGGLRRFAVQNRLTQQGFDRLAVEGGDGLVASQESAFGILEPRGVGNVVQNSPLQPLRLLQRDFGAFPFGDVTADPHDPIHAALFAMQRYETNLDPLLTGGQCERFVAAQRLACFEHLRRHLAVVVGGLRRE